jgi:O-antigen ligase
MSEKQNVLSDVSLHAEKWHNRTAKFALIFFCIALWHNNIVWIAFLVLVAAWFLDDGHRRLRETIKEPLVLAILILCGFLALGMFWGNFPEEGYFRWKKYFILLAFIPFLSLLNKSRLPWAIAALLVGYLSVLFFGIYQWTIVGVQGIPPLKMKYLSFSAMIGVGVILMLCLALTSKDKKNKLLGCIIALSLLFVQFNQEARGPLLATLLASAFVIFLCYKSEIRKLLCMTVVLVIVVVAYAYSSDSFQKRLIQARDDIKLSQQDRYDSHLGYRLALWDVGLHGIAQRPWLGHGTGTPERYFNETIVTYKGGKYKDLLTFEKTTHYHNDLIEIGMHIGLLGLLSFVFFLWSWFKTFKNHRLTLLGAALVCFIFLAGITDAFILYSRIPALMLVITAILICWQRENRRVSSEL